MCETFVRLDLEGLGVGGKNETKSVVGHENESGGWGETYGWRLVLLQGSTGTTNGGCCREEKGVKVAGSILREAAKTR